MNNEDQNSNLPKESHIMPIAEERRKPVLDPTGRVEDITAEEIKIADVRRHPIGLFFLYLQVFIAVGLAFTLIVFLLPGFLDTTGVSDSSANGFLAIFGFIVALFGLIFLILAHRIYSSNQLIITNENVTHVNQVSLFHRQVSEISMGNVEDVTAHQQGILPTFFNYGRLHIETAGEQNNYDFLYCPNPNAFAKAIQDARLEFIKTHGD